LIQPDSHPLANGIHKQKTISITDPLELVATDAKDERKADGQKTLIFARKQND